MNTFQSEQTHQETGNRILADGAAKSMSNFHEGQEYFIYASTMRPMSASWARLDGATYVTCNATVVSLCQHVYTYIIVPTILDEGIRNSLELTPLYGPVVATADYPQVQS